MKKLAVARLLEQFIPSHYGLRFDLDVEHLRFTGTAQVVGQLTQPSSTLKLHAKDLNISRARLGDKDLTYTINADDELILDLLEKLRGEVGVEIDFSGTISQQMHGIYICNFEVDGQRKRIIATQFESHHAREAFPCIDEPAGKATFDLTITTGADHTTVLGNTPVKYEQPQASTKTVVFETTPRMSPYLLAFVAGELHGIEGKTKEGILVRCWSHAGIDKEQLRFALDHGIRSIEFFNDYYGTDYPLTKCDHVALPDFEFGAMENWGLITYRETILLCDPTNRSHAQERYCAMVVSHELSHQWFGNLVTMNWWDDLWLNESFASIMEFVALDVLYPDWHMWEQFVVDDALRAVARDVLPGVQQVGVPVNHPDEIHSLFDPAIVYAKGSRLLNMLRCFIGDEVFQKGLQQYFARHAYQNTSREDLWAAMSEASGNDISHLMTPWLTQSNLPLLIVDHDSQQYEVSQKRFAIDGSSPGEQTWPIPLFAKPEVGINVLENTNYSFGSPKFTRFNDGALSHAVVYYQEPADRAKLSQQLSDRELPAPDRANYLSDLVLLARGGLLSITDVLQAVLVCQGEDREAVWQSLAYALSAGRMIVEGDIELEDDFKSASWHFVEPTVQRLGWQKQDVNATNDNQVRNITLGIASHTDNDVFVNAMRPYYDAHKNDWTGCDSDLRPIVMAAAVEHGFDGAFENLLAIAHDPEALPDLKVDADSALVSSRDEKRIEQLIGLLKDKSVIRQQDLIRWFAGLLSNQYARDVAWKWMVSEWEWIVEHFADTASYDRFPRITATVLKTHEELNAYKEFFDPKRSEISLKRTIEIGIGEIEARVAWRDRDQAKLREWLKNQG